MRKGAGIIIELGSIAAFGFSPLWLLAAASDVARGSRVYLDSLVGELKVAGVARPYGRAVESHFDPRRVTWTERGLERLTRGRRRRS